MYKKGEHILIIAVIKGRPLFVTCGLKNKTDLSVYHKLSWRTGGGGEDSFACIYQDPAPDHS